MKRRIAALGGGLLLVALTAGAGQQPIRVLVSPKMALEPASLLISVITERHVDNRLLRVVAVSEDFANSSDRQLEGESSSKIATFEFREVPAGEYQIRATLVGADGHVRGEAADRVLVISRSGIR